MLNFLPVFIKSGSVVDMEKRADLELLVIGNVHYHIQEHQIIFMQAVSQRTEE